MKAMAEEPGWVRLRCIGPETAIAVASEMPWAYSLVEWYTGSNPATRGAKRNEAS